MPDIISPPSGGGFFGGLAGGLQKGQENILAQQTQQLAEQKQQASDQATQRQEAMQQINNLLGIAKDTFKAVTDGGHDPQKAYTQIQPLTAAAQKLAAGIGLPNDYVASAVQAMSARPALEDADSKKTIVTTAGGLGQPDRIHMFDTKKGTLTPIDPKTGQPILSPAETITPRQAQVANPQDEATLPPGAQPVQLTDSTFGNRFASMQQPGPQLNSNLNHDVIADLPPGVQEKIKGVADGTIDIKNFSQRLGKNGKAPRDEVLELVKQYDPSFDTANAPARAATLKAFKSGVEARKLTALGTVIGHVSELNENGLALDNWKSNTFGVGTQAANKMRLWAEENKQSPIITKFDNSVTAVSSELATAFRGNTTAVSDIQDWRKGMNASMSPDQIRASTQQLGKLLLARMSELKEQWDRGMGHNQDPSIATKLAATRNLLEKMSAGTLFSDRTAPTSKANVMKSKYGLD